MITLLKILKILNCFPLFFVCGISGTFFLIMASLFSPIFGKFLYGPHFTGEASVWAIHVCLIPILAFPKFLEDRKEFHLRFPGANSIEQVCMYIVLCMYFNCLIMIFIVNWN